jgi:hypothetical protein
MRLFRSGLVKIEELALHSKGTVPHSSKPGRKTPGGRVWGMRQDPNIRNSLRAGV